MNPDDIVVQAPDGGLIYFPGTMTDEEIAEVMRREFPPRATPDLRSQWQISRDDPERRRDLTLQIANEFAKRMYAGEREGDPRTGLEAIMPKGMRRIYDKQRGGLEAFMKTAADIGIFGLGRNKLQREMRKAFPGMTVEESRLGVDEIERLQFEMKPAETIAGGLLGVAGSMGGGVGLAKGGSAGVQAGASALSRQFPQLGQIPQQVSNAIRTGTTALGFRKATPTPKQIARGEGVTALQRIANVGLNLGRAAGASAAGAAGYEMIGKERDPREAPVDMAFATGLGALAPIVAPAVAAGFKRAFLPTRVAQDVIEDKIGAQGGDRARAQIEALGERPAVAAAALDPTSGARIAPFLPDQMSAYSGSARAQEAVEKAAQERIGRTFTPERAKSAEDIKRTAEYRADDFTQQFGDELIPTEIITDDFARALEKLGDFIGERDKKSIVNMLRKRPEITLSEYDQLRRYVNTMADLKGLPTAAKEIRDEFLKTAKNKIDKMFPGYSEAILTKYARDMRMAAGAEVGPRALKDIPSEFQSALKKGIPAREIPTRMVGARLGLGEELRRRGATGEGAMDVMGRLGEPDVARNIASVMPQTGPALSKAAPAYIEGMAGARSMKPPTPAQAGNTPTVEDIAQAGAATSRYFQIKSLFDALDRAAMPKSVRQEISDLLSDPAKVGQGIEAMIRAQRRGDITNMSEESLRRLLARTVSRGTVASQTGQAMVRDMDLEENPDFLPADRRTADQRRIDNAMGQVNRMIYELRGTQTPVSAADFAKAEQALRMALENGFAIDDAMAIAVRSVAGNSPAMAYEE